MMEAPSKDGEHRAWESGGGEMMESGKDSTMNRKDKMMVATMRSRLEFIKPNKIPLSPVKNGKLPSTLPEGSTFLLCFSRIPTGSSSSSSSCSEQNVRPSMPRSSHVLTPTCSIFPAS